MAELPKVDLESKDLVAERIEQMKALFPEIITEGEGTVDFERLRLILGDHIEEGDERYAFTWPGKVDAIRQSQSVSSATLRPVEEESVNWSETENLYIEGDNLEVLKLLQRAYHGKIRFIYIDPPYNTGKDFVYHDTFGDTLENYRQQSGQTGQSNPETSGRYHSDWCSMMYPRLKLARELLSDDGLLFVSINDYEHINAAKLLEDVFGLANFVEEYIWESTFRPDNSSPVYRKNAEYVICYAKDKSSLQRLVGDRQKSEGLPSLTKNSMKESTLFFRAGEVITYMSDGHYTAGNKGSYTLENDVDVKDGRIVSDFRLTGRVIWGQDYLEQQLAKGTEIIIKNESFVPYSKKNEETVHSPTKLVPNDRVGDVLKANAERDELFDTKVFDYPKPTSLLTYLISFIDNDDFIVMDFFSGSGTTAHAAMLSNLADGGKRRFIMVQLPETTPENSAARNAGYDNLCQVGEERIRRAGAKIVSMSDASRQQLQFDGESNDTPDVGFRVFRLDDSGISQPEEGQLLIDRIKPDRTDLDIIFEMMLKWGLELTYPVEEDEIEGYPVYSIAYDELICCMEPGLTTDVLEAIAARNPRRVFLLDSVIDDTVKLNALQIFKRVEERTQQKIDLRTV
jgi:adenine-specific DNA-methyltransferase